MAVGPEPAGTVESFASFLFLSLVFPRGKGSTVLLFPNGRGKGEGEMTRTQNNLHVNIKIGSRGDTSS